MSACARRSPAVVSWALAAISQLVGCDTAKSFPLGSAGAAGSVAIAPAAGKDAAGTPGQPAASGGSGGSVSLPVHDAGPAGMSATTPPPAPADPVFQVARSTVAADSKPSISDSDFALYVSQINKFGLALGQAVASANKLTTGNVIYSPLSASIALGMTYAGARTQTAAEMKSVLGDTFAEGQFHAAANRLTRQLAARQTTGVNDSGSPARVELHLADALFAERTLMIQAPLLDLLGREYDSGVNQLDFRGAPDASRVSINAWVSSQTKNKINDLFPDGSITDATRFVLVNALYFYGSWANGFEANSTTFRDFHTLAGTTVQLLAMQGHFSVMYKAGADYSVAELPYQGQQLRMTIVLPATDKFEKVRGQVSGAWLDEAVRDLASTTLQVQLPKFEMTTDSVSLTQGLQALGMKLAFTPQADFSGITTDTALSISDVLQKAFISVDQNGTEAAAATGVGGFATSAAPVLTPFIVDHPFLFFIRDATGAVLFSGQVVDPTL